MFLLGRLKGTECSNVCNRSEMFVMECDGPLSLSSNVV